jgi:hypothetical protein
MTARLFSLASVAVSTGLMVVGPSSVRGQVINPSSPTPQTSPRDTRPAQTGTAVIRGRVVAGDTRKPLRRARITVSAPELGGQPRTVGTDADGNYEVLDLPAARYRVEARRSGYLPLQYGQTRPLEQGKPLQLLAGQRVERVDFLLPRMSVISGRVTDEVGDPIEGVMVMALRSRYWEGQRQLIPTGSGPVMSDDAGEYRILGLTPGMYYVMAVTRETWTVSQNGVTSVMGYTPTYFPGSPLVAEARRVTLALGQEAGVVDFSLVPGRTANISGTALDSRGRPFDRVVLREEVRGENFARFGGTISGSVSADGAFTLRNVTPGDYKLVATTGRETEHPEVAIVPIAVESVDITGVTLTGSEGGSILGRIRTDTGEVPKIPQLRVTVGVPLRGQPDPALLGTFRNPGMSEVTSDGAFSIKGVFGRSRLRVTLPDEWMVTTISHEGRDITDTPIELGSSELLTDVEVVITNRVTTVEGAVVNEKGLPSNDATVLVFASDATRWSDDSRAVRAARPDQTGRFQIKGLPAGEYVALALDYVEDGMWNDPEYLESIRSHGQKLSIAEAGAHSISLKLLTP